MNFNTAKELLDICQSQNISISEAMILREMSIFNISRLQVLEKMQKTYNVMKNSALASTTQKHTTMGGLIGGEALLLNQSRISVSGSVVKKATMYALSVLEINASMGVIVAAPTAGSSGVLPACLVSISEEHNISDDKVVNALFNAAAIGYLITKNATVSGAEGGCQAEIGSASAMAASCITELLGGSARMCFDAASTALANMLGLVCDPIGGLVEAPCAKRNVLGATNALTCAEMSLCGITHIVDFDDMIDVMYGVGKSIPSSLRETALGGMAVAPLSCSRCKN